MSDAIDACNRCGKPILPRAADWLLQRGRVCVCPPRTAGVSLAGRVTQMKLPLQPGRATQRVTEREEAVQAAIVAALTAAGYMVEQTTVRMRAQICPHCGRAHGFNPLRRGGYGATAGVADLLVRHPSWPVAVYAQLEVKGSETRVSERQAQKAQAGHLVIVRSVEEAFAALAAVGAAVGSAQEREHGPCPPPA